MNRRFAVAGLLIPTLLASSAPAAAQHRRNMLDDDHHGVFDDGSRGLSRATDPGSSRTVGYGTLRNAERGAFVIPRSLPLQRDTMIASTSSMVAGGLLFGALGFFGGGWAGSMIERGTVDNCYDFCGLGGALIGAAVGESIGVASGVHLANHGRGNWLGNATLMTALGLGGGLFALSAENGPITLGVLLFTPVAQLLISSHIERSSMK